MININLSISSLDQLTLILNELDSRGLLPNQRKELPKPPSVITIKKSEIESLYNAKYGTFRMTLEEKELFGSNAKTRDELIQDRVNAIESGLHVVQGGGKHSIDDHDNDDSYNPLTD